jgi:hypothetical protein
MALEDGYKGHGYVIYEYYSVEGMRTPEHQIRLPGWREDPAVLDEDGSLQD